MRPPARTALPSALSRALVPVLSCALLAALVLGLPAGASAQNPESEGSLVVTGTGIAVGEPDIARLSMAARAEARSPAEALSAANENIAAVIEAMRALGIADRDLQTAAVDLQPVYARAEPGRPARITGYRSVNRLSITVRDFEIVGQAITKGTEAGADELGRIAFDIEDRAALEAEARKAAMRDAMARAAQLAEAGDLTLGPIRQVSEGGGAMPMQDARMVAVASLEAAPVMGGTLEARVSVSVRFALLDAE
ncbi:MAG: SIMPL domain-containing protein [Pseudomonadota bacterium]